MSRWVTGVVVGGGATMLMDLWNLFLRSAFGIPSLSYCLLGRWILHMPEGRLRHRSIAAAAQKPRECAVGWVTHYTIGAVLAMAFVALAGEEWLRRPTPGAALGFGIVTLVFPLLVLQPALGLGIASSRTPRPAQARMKSLVTHLVFGLGLYVCALGLTLTR